MKKLLFGTTLISLPLLASTVYANTVTTGNASSTVVVNNQVDSSNNSSTTTHTHITVNTGNGDQTYDSDQGGNVQVHSTNGQTTVTVNGENKELSPAQKDNSQTQSATPTASQTEVKQKSSVSGQTHATQKLSGITVFFTSLFAFFKHLW